MSSQSDIAQQFLNGGVVPADLVGQETVSKTYVDGQIDLQDAEIASIGSQASTAQATIDSHKASASAHSASSITYSGSVSASTVKGAIDTQNQRIDNIVGSAGESNTEIVDARQPATGSPFSVLGDRLNNFDTQLAENKFDLIYRGYNVRLLGGGQGGDDTVLIKQIVSMIKLAGSGSIYFPPLADEDDSYNISDTIKLPSNIIVYGGGYNSQIKWIGSQGKPMFQNEFFDTFYNENTAQTDISICYLRIVANALILGGTNIAISLGNVKNPKIHNNYIRNSYSAGIAFTPCQRGWIYRNEVSGGNSTSANNGITVDNSSYDIQITNNIVKDVYDAGIGVHNNSTDIVVSNNTIINTMIGPGIDIAGAHRVAVSSNTIVSSSSRGIIVHDNLSYYCSYIAVTGNTVVDIVNGDAIAVIGDTLQVDNVTVTGNIIKVSTMTGQGVQISKHVINVTVGDNTINGLVDQTIGILVSQLADAIPTNCVISSNPIFNCLIGVALQSNVYGCAIRDNITNNVGTSVSYYSGQLKTNNINGLSEEPTAIAFYGPSGWLDFGGGTVETAQYFKDKKGLVSLIGAMKNGTTTAGTLIFTLPVGYRPAKYRSFVVDANNAFGTIEVNADGTVRIKSITSNTYVSLDGISFMSA